MHPSQAERFGKALEKWVAEYVAANTLESAEVQVTAELDVQTVATYSSNGGS